MSSSGARARPPSQPTGQSSGQPSVEEMLVSIRKAIHGDNTKNAARKSTINANSESSNSRAAVKPVSGSMRQTRVSLNGSSGAHSSRARAGSINQASVRTHSDNFQKLKKQLHELDPLLGKQGERRVVQDRANGSANGFAGILNGDIKLEEALAKLERAGLGEHEPVVEPTLLEETGNETALRGAQNDELAPSYDQYEDYEFDTRFQGEHGESTSPPQLQRNTFANSEPEYLRRSIPHEPAPTSVVAAPPVASSPLAPPPEPRQPSYGYEAQEHHTQPEPSFQTQPQTNTGMRQKSVYDEDVYDEEVYEETYIASMPAQPASPQNLPIAPRQARAPQSVARPAVAANSPTVRGATGLTSPQNAQAASDAFATLAETIMHQASVGNRSIDQLTKELLHPMLRGWLDENLPDMVERLIREEIERVARGGFRP